MVADFQQVDTGGEVAVSGRSPACTEDNDTHIQQSSVAATGVPQNGFVRVY